LVGLASNFIIGDEVIPLNAKKHTETPSIDGIDPACVFNRILLVNLLLALTVAAVAAMCGLC